MSAITLYREDGTIITQSGFCSCHDGRPITRENDDAEWMHCDDETYADTFHIHFEHKSRDCDGRYSRGCVYTLDDCASSPWWQVMKDLLRREDPTSDDLWEWISPAPQRTSGQYATIHIVYGPDSIAVTIGDEEGGSTGLYTECNDGDCCEHPERNYYRDHSAESAGY